LQFSQVMEKSNEASANQLVPVRKPADRPLEPYLLQEATVSWQDFLEESKRDRNISFNLDQRALAFDLFFVLRRLSTEPRSEQPYFGWLLSPRLKGNSTLMKAFGAYAQNLGRPVVYLTAQDYADDFNLMDRLPSGKSLVIIDDFSSFHQNHHAVDQLVTLLSETRDSNILFLAMDDDDLFYDDPDPLLVEHASFVIDGQQAVSHLCAGLLSDAKASQRRFDLDLEDSF
jgi:hypothetical protein